MLFEDFNKTEFINSLDVWVVSHGGVGSNYIVDLLEENGYRARGGKRKPYASKYGFVCHLAYKPQDVNTKTLYIYGDIVNSICSQENRHLLDTNKYKLSCGHNNDNPKDPYNYLYQYSNFYNDESVVKLKYPYTEESIMDAFKKLNLEIYIPPVVKKRATEYKKPHNKKVENVLKYYRDSVLK
mgnify:CR=1 FL=1